MKLILSEIPCSGHQITKISAQFQSEAALLILTYKTCAASGCVAVDGYIYKTMVSR